MNKSSLGEEWVKNPDGTPGYTWNPITGCLNGCEYCYARKLANTRLKARYLANHNTAMKKTELPNNMFCIEAGWTGPFHPRFWEDRMRVFIPRYAGSRHLTKKRRGIFVCDMSDLFGIGVPEEWTRKVLKAVELWPEHRFYLLTKQPQNLKKFSPFPDNAWVGVSATDTASYQDAYRYLGEIEAKVRYISFEPLLGAIYTQGLNSIPPYYNPRGFPFDWVIIGALTGTLNDLKKLAMQYSELPLMPYGKKWTLQPKIEWVREIVEACDKAGIPVFLKNNLKPLLKLHTNENVFWADHRDKAGFEDLHLELRQEMQGALDAGEPHKLPLAGSNPAPATKKRSEE